MLFRTVVPLTCPAHVDPLRHADQLTLIGSCFSEGVGQRLQDCGHKALINPLGTIFNPVSLARVVALLASGEEILDSDLEYCNRQQHYFSFEAGTSMVGEDASSCAEKLTEAIGAGRTALSQSACLFLTLGSAWAYVRPGSGPVANCHRQPQAEFKRTLLCIDEIETSLVEAIASARSLNPSVRVVLTVSPVRHWREGPVESSRSKAHLLAAAHNVCEQAESTVYFPSYELLMDELRDYRWYAEDMLHPSEPAVDYVAQRLLETFFDPKDDALRESVKQIRTARRHRHARPQSAATRAFAAAQLAKVTELRAAHQYLDLEADEQYFAALASPI